MSELTRNPAEIFTPDSPNIMFEDINGFLVPILELSDTRGSYIAIPALNDELSDICGQFICGHLISEIDYDTYNGKPAIIKAYYSYQQ